MGRTNGKLKTFLKDALQKNSFHNLKWEDQDSEIFSLELPRYEKKKDLSDYEKILNEWSVVNNRKYPGYSGAKAVLQAALKKSVYLVCMNRNSNDLRFRFATKAEEQEKRKKQKLDSLILQDPLQEASQLNCVSIKPEIPVLCKLEYSFPSLLSPSPPLPSLSPSPSNSSGYQSGSDDLDGNISVYEDTNLSGDPLQEASHLNLVSIKPDMPVVCEMEYSFSSLASPSPPLPSFSPALFLPSLSQSPSSSSDCQGRSEDLDGKSVSEETNFSEDPDFLNVLDDLLQNPDNYINALQDISKDIEMDAIQSDISEENIASVPQNDTKINGAEFMQPPVLFPEKPVIELTAMEVNSSQTLNTYWLCTRKLYVDSTLLLICDKQVIKDENQGITPGQIDLNNVLEPRESYNLQKMFELDGKCFLFLSRSR